MRTDGSSTKDKAEQAAELLSTFLSPLPEVIEDEAPRPQRPAMSMPRLAIEEVERRVFAAKPWKASGDDGLPAVMWRQIWPVVKDRVLLLFQTSLDDGELPVRWRKAKIIPLKKLNNGNYTAAKAWRPVSLLSTLGKTIESVVAERISHAIKTLGLLPTNHFRARKECSAKQAALPQGLPLSLILFVVFNADLPPTWSLRERRIYGVCGWFQRMAYRTISRCEPRRDSSHNQ